MEKFELIVDNRGAARRNGEHPSHHRRGHGKISKTCACVGRALEFRISLLLFCAGPRLAGARNARGERCDAPVEY